MSAKQKTFLPIKLSADHLLWVGLVKKQPAAFYQVWSIPPIFFCLYLFLELRKANRQRQEFKNKRRKLMMFPRNLHCCQKIVWLSAE